MKIAEEEATFDEFMVWGHESMPEELADPFVRGMEEWIDFAQTVCNDGPVQWLSLTILVDSCS